MLIGSLFDRSIHKIANGSNSLMINKSKPFTTGERRSFVTRIRSFMSQTDPANRTGCETDKSSYSGNPNQTDPNIYISNKKPSEPFSSA